MTNKYECGCEGTDDRCPIHGDDIIPVEVDELEGNPADYGDGSP